MHSLYFPKEDVRIPLALKGIISYVITRYPSNQEIDNCRWLVVTGDHPWNPYSDDFAAHEQNYVDREHYSLHPHTHVRDIMSLSSQIHHRMCSIQTNCRRLSFPDERIAHIFNCSPKVTSLMRQVTTQKGICSVTDHLTRRFRTKQAALRYDQLGGKHGRFYSDTMFSSVTSARGNTMGQIFVNDIGFTHLIPM
jgi:hypothetical protein